MAPPTGLHGPPHTETPATTPSGTRGGLGCGTVALVVLCVVLLIAARKLGTENDSFLWWVGGAGAIYLTAGVALRSTAKDEEGRRYERLRSPPLGTAALPLDERTWIDGALRSPHPVMAPEFGVPCVWMHVLVTVGTGRSKKTERDEAVAAQAFVIDGTGSAEVDLSTVRFDQLHTWTSDVDGRAVAVTFVRDGEPVSVCGRVQSDAFPSVDAELRQIAERAVPAAAFAAELGAEFGAVTRSRVDKDVDRTDAASKRDGAGKSASLALTTSRSDGGPTRLRIVPSSDAPVLVTPLARSAWNAHAEAEEVQDRVSGTLILLLGAGAVAGAALVALATESNSLDVDAPALWILGVGLGVAAALLVVSARELRRLRRWRERGELAASDLEKELSRPDAVAERIAARVTVYEDVAGAHDAALARWPVSLLASCKSLRPFPPRG